MPDSETPTAGLIAPEAQTATANAMGSLRRTIEARATAAQGATPTLRGGGPTLEDVVRDELRPMLKTWLDANLPTMVERLVAAEIERLIKQALPDAKVDIRDLAGDGDHYAATVVSAAFKGKSRVQQHQLVYRALQGQMGGVLHALALQTSAE